MDWEDLTYEPSGGRTRQIFVGLVLAISLGNLAVWCFVHEIAWLLSSSRMGGSGSAEVHGEPARWVALFYLGIALFMHFHWFWGLVPAWRVSQTGKIISCIIAIVGLFRAMWLLFFY